VTSTRLDATDRARLNPSGLRLALAGMLLGLLYAAVSVYWGLGGTTLSDTIGGSLERGGRAGDLVVVLALWAAAVLKVIAAVLPLLAIYRLGGMGWQRNVVRLAWFEAAVLVIYGLVLTTVGLLVQLGNIAASASADHRALAWHAYLRDPWFLVWGLLVTAALLRTRHRNKKTTDRMTTGKRRDLSLPAERVH